MGLADHRLPAAHIAKMIVVGINHQNTPVAVRSAFAFTEANRNALFQSAKQHKCRSIFVLSTCNRSEIYAIGYSDAELIELFFQCTNGNANLFQQYGFVKYGSPALHYFFSVAAGLQSQIVGDYEIVAQLRSAVDAARSEKLIGPMMDRIINFGLQASKAVRTKTQISNGTVSVSYAAIEWLKGIKDMQHKSVLLIGAGTMSKGIAKSLQHYGIGKSVAIVNRTLQTAKALAEETGAQFQAFDRLNTAIEKADVVIVCTNAPNHIVQPQHFSGTKNQLVIDLSVPENVNPAVKDIQHVQLLGIDEISQKMQQTLRIRHGEVAKARAIVAEHLDLLYDWLALYKYNAAIHLFKAQLFQLDAWRTGVQSPTLEQRINKTIGGLVAHLRNNKGTGCQFIGAMNSFLNANLAHEGITPAYAKDSAGKPSIVHRLPSTVK